MILLHWVGLFGGSDLAADGEAHRLVLHRVPAEADAFAMVRDEIDGAELLKIGQISAVLPFQQLDRAVRDRNRKNEAVMFWAKLDVVRTVARVDIVTAFPLPALLLFLVLSVAPDYDLSVLPARGKNRARAIAAELRIGPGDFPDGARVRVISV